jgi:demethylmenaquinone methyltransferase / 2-methoxy-6-polyprenyl-1,4-benzoquinol methylase
MENIINFKDNNKRITVESATNQNLSGSNTFARHLFDGIAGNYDRPAYLFSLFQYYHWRNFLISRLRLDSKSRILDVCTGPGGVAIAMAKKGRCHVVGVDISDSMLEKARSNILASNLSSLVTVEKARAEQLPFDEQTFDAVVFTFLFRYLDEPKTVLTELARVLKPGGQMASLEFCVPRGPLLYPLWLLYTRLVLPLGTRFITRGWSEVGSFLGPSISEFFRQYSLEEIAKMWADAGLIDVQTRILSHGGAFVMWGGKTRQS